MAGVAFAITIHHGDVFLFKCKREARDEGQTFPELIVASFKSQGEKEKDYSGHWSTKKQQQLPRIELKCQWIPAICLDRLPEGALWR